CGSRSRCCRVCSCACLAPDVSRQCYCVAPVGVPVTAPTHRMRAPSGAVPRHVASWRGAASLNSGQARSTQRSGRRASRRGPCMLSRVAARLPFYYGWIIVAVVFVTMGIGVNARTSFSLLYPPILDEFGWDRGVTAGVFSFGFLLSAFLSPVLGRMIDTRGRRGLTLIGVAA